MMLIIVELKWADKYTEPPKPLKWLGLFISACARRVMRARAPKSISVRQQGADFKFLVVVIILILFHHGQIILAEKN